MIYTAEVARQQANQKKANKQARRSSRQLRQIERKICRASKNGKKSLIFTKSLYEDVKSTLRKNKYRIHERSNYKWGELAEIAWNDK